MNRDLDGDSLRPQTEVLVDEADAPASRKLLDLATAFVPTMALTLYTIRESKRLPGFVDAVSDERLPLRSTSRGAIGRVGTAPMNACHHLACDAPETALAH